MYVQILCSVYIRVRRILKDFKLQMYKLIRNIASKATFHEVQYCNIILSLFWMQITLKSIFVAISRV